MVIGDISHYAVDSDQSLDEADNGKTSLMDWFADTNRVSIMPEEAKKWEDVIYNILKNGGDISRLERGIRHIKTMTKFIRFEKQLSLSSILVNGMVRAYNDIYGEEMYKACIQYLNKNHANIPYDIDFWMGINGTKPQMIQLYKLYRLWYSDDIIESLQSVIGTKYLNPGKQCLLIDSILAFDVDNISGRVTEVLSRCQVRRLNILEMMEKHVTDVIATDILYKYTVDYDKCLHKNEENDKIYYEVVDWLLKHGANSESEHDGTTVVAIHEKWNNRTISKSEKSCLVQ